MSHVGTDSNSNYYDYFIIKLNNYGKVLWTTQMGYNFLCGNDSDYLLSSIATNNNSPKKNNLL